MNGRLAIAGILLVAALASAVLVIYAEHRNRRLFAELQRLQTARDELNIEWGRLQLEQSTWVAHGRVEELARERLHMRLPSAETTLIIRP